MNRSTILCAFVVWFSANLTIPAQQSSSSPSAMSASFCLIKMFGTNDCTAKCDVKILNDSFKESSIEGFALLDGKIREEMDISQYKAQMFPPAAVRQMGIDQQVAILRPDLKLTYNIYPRLKAYVIRSLPTNDLAAQGKEPTLAVTELGQEDVDGHPCVKKRFVVTTGDGEKHEVLAWLASDLKNFPVKTQLKDEDNIEVTTYKQIQFIQPDAKLFEPPAGFIEYKDFDEMMDKTQPSGGADLTNTNTIDTPVDNERLNPIVDYTLQNGTNRPIGPLTAKALGLGTNKIPVTTILLGKQDESVVHLFGVSAQNTNDLFVIRVDREKHTGTIWLTSRSGRIRATVLTPTNPPPMVVSNELYAEAFDEELNVFFQFITPPPWEDAPHPLNVAAKFGAVSDVEKILNRDITAINMQDDEGMTPVACAVVQDQIDVVQFLLDNGADPNIPNKNGLTPLEHACGHDKTNGMILAKMLLAKGALVNPTNYNKLLTTPLDWAVTSDNTDLVKLLLNAGADAKASDDNGDTALYTAASRGDLEIAEMLIAQGADVNSKINGGTTSLHEAAWNGHEAMMKLLLSKGAEADAKRIDGLTPLINAAGPGAERSGKGCVEILLAKGVNINASDENGETPLFKAAYYGNKDVVEILLAHGALINATNKNGKTPLKVASKPEIAELLRQHGAKE
jgi:uncharacterized protein